MSKFIRIQSTVTINVTSGLSHQDVTEPNQPIPNRLKVNPMWTKTTVLVRKGVGVYPAEIKEWPVVQALVKDKVFTISDVATGEEPTSDEKKVADELAQALAEEKARLERETAMKHGTKSVGNIDLGKIAGK